MKGIYALSIVMVLSIQIANAQVQSSAIRAVQLVEDAYGQWQMKTLSFPNGGMMYVETRGGESSKLKICEDCHVQTIGRRIKGMNRPYTFIKNKGSITLVGDVIIRIADSRFVDSIGNAAFKDAKTHLRYKDARVNLQAYEF